MSIKITSWNMAGFEEIRRAPKVLAEIERVATNIAAQAGRGYKASAQQGAKGPSPSWNKKKGKGHQGRARAIVYPETFRAMRDNAKNNTQIGRASCRERV